MRVSENQHKWYLRATEFPWEKGFVDLLLTRGPVTLVAECKRALDEQWIFLVPEDADTKEKRARLEWWNGRAPDLPLMESTIFTDRVFCDDFQVLPPSSESEYCVVPKGKSAVTSLETVCHDLLAAVHYIADLPDVEHTSDFEVLVPLVVTNAELTTCKFKRWSYHAVPSHQMGLR
ncbi:MAG: hypothetical protein JSW46_13240 [Gemmatimonadota bacterium]|nr:MAG: hypothetical protein JSW46_13240 [Gemmatimonadota bacterium]